MFEARSKSRRDLSQAEARVPIETMREHFPALEHADSVPEALGGAHAAMVVID